MKTIKSSTVKPLATLLLLAACNAPATRDDAADREIRRLEDRINQLEDDAKASKQNIDTLFQSRDALRRLIDYDKKVNETALGKLRQNDRYLNENSPRPLGVIED